MTPSVLTKTKGVALFAQARRLTRIGVLSVVLIFVATVAGSTSMDLPASDGETLTLPLRYIVPLILAVVTCGCLHGRDNALDGMYSHTRDGTQIFLLAGNSVATVILLGVLQAVMTDLPEAAVVTRNYLGFLGLSLISGRLVGWGFCWAIPLFSLFPLTYFPRNSDEELNWWVFIAAPANDQTSWLVVAFLVIFGGIAVLWPPWHLYYVKRLYRTNR